MKKLAIHTEFVGVEQTPVMIVDNFAPEVSSLIAIAAQSEFTADQYSMYPGVRSQLPKPYVIQVLDQVYNHIYKIYQIPHQLRLKPQDIYFSLITHQAEQLSPMQRIPHFDTSRPYYFAVLHYLAEPPHGGTALFRHKSTGFERITEARCDVYLSALQAEFDDKGEPAAKYCTESNQFFEKYYEIPYHQNRLVIYPGNLLHSTCVKPQFDINDDVNKGRLTANIFIEFK